MRHASCQRWAWLIFDVGRTKYSMHDQQYEKVHADITARLKKELLPVWDIETFRAHYRLEENFLPELKTRLEQEDPVIYSHTCFWRVADPNKQHLVLRVSYTTSELGNPNLQQ
jgi:hypothetical protein